VAVAAKPEPIAISPFLQGNKLHVFTPTPASEAFSNQQMVDGLRAVTNLIAGQCGQKASLAVKAIWLGVDGVSTYHAWRDPQSSLADRAIATGQLGGDGLALLGAVLASSPLEGTANVISFTALIGDHLHTGKITLSQSEVVGFSSHPQAEDISNLLKLTEVFVPPVTT